MRNLLSAVLLSLGCYNFAIEPPSAVCGDGVVNEGEQCDDGNNLDGDGCEADCTIACEEPIDCDDDNACTVESCVSNRCQFEVVDPNDGNVCTTDTCDPAAGVVNAPVEIEDNNACTVDSCDPVTGVSNAPIDPNDQNDCTIDACDPVTGVSNDPADDGTACALSLNETGVCIAASCESIVCGDGFVSGGEGCDDGENEANDGCDPGCQLEANLFVRCGDPVAGNGTLDNPFNELQAGLNAALSGQKVMILPDSPSACAGATINDGVELFGLADPTADNLPARPTIDGVASPALLVNSPAVVRVSDLLLTSSADAGTIDTENTLLAISRVEIQNSGTTGPAMFCVPESLGFLLLDQSVVHDSAGGGVRVGGACSFLAANSLFLNNGAANSTRGAVEVESNNAHAEVCLSTFSGNRADTNTIIDLLDPQTIVNSRAVGVIVDDNNIGTNTPGGNGLDSFDQDLTNVSFSIFFGEDVAGQGNQNADPLFATVGAGLAAPFHLQGDSPARNVVTGNVALIIDTVAVFGIDVLSHDFDGNPRGATTDAGMFDE
jgi:cysteine-rich repeat protein